MRYLYGNRSKSSRGSGVRAEPRGSQGWGGLGRATQAAARLSVVCCVLYSGTRIVRALRNMRQTLIAVAYCHYYLLPATASAGPLPAPLGGAGAGRGGPRGTLPHWGCLGHCGKCHTWVGGSADSAASPTSAAPPARRPTAPGAGSGSVRASRLHGVMPHRGRRHICPPAGCERGGGVVQRPLCWGERQLQRRRGGAQLELPDHVVKAAAAVRRAVDGQRELDGAAEEELRLELEGRRPARGFQLPQVSKKPGSRQLVRILYPCFNLSDCR